MSFALDERLARDALVVGDLPFSRVLLMNDARWPWIGAADRALLIEEAARAALFLKAYAEADKINVGALGNVVRQFHLHIVARAIGDVGWPGPVWGHGAATPYDEAKARAHITAARAGLGI